MAANAALTGIVLLATCGPTVLLHAFTKPYIFSLRALSPAAPAAAAGRWDLGIWGIGRTAAGIDLTYSQDASITKRLTSMRAYTHTHTRPPNPKPQKATASRRPAAAAAANHRRSASGPRPWTS